MLHAGLVLRPKLELSEKQTLNSTALRSLADGTLCPLRTAAGGARAAGAGDRYSGKARKGRGPRSQCCAAPHSTVKTLRGSVPGAPSAPLRTQVLNLLSAKKTHHSRHDAQPSVHPTAETPPPAPTPTLVTDCTKPNSAARPCSQDEPSARSGGCRPTGGCWCGGHCSSLHPRACLA